LLYKTAEEKVTFSFDNLKMFQKFNPEIHICMDMYIFTGASKSRQFSVDVFRVFLTLSDEVVKKGLKGIFSNFKRANQIVVFDFLKHGNKTFLIHNQAALAR